MANAGGAEAPMCITCCEPMRGVGLPMACGHRALCAECALRMIDIHGTQACPMCKVPSAAWFFAERADAEAPRQPNETHSLQIPASDSIAHCDSARTRQAIDRARHLRFDPAVAAGEAHAMQWPAAEGGDSVADDSAATGADAASQTFRSWNTLRSFVQKDAGREFCRVCTHHRHVFPAEQRTYSKGSLRRHLDKGDAATDHFAAVPSHPPCRFCRRRFFDADSLEKHMDQDHHFCHVCSAQGGAKQYFADFEGLSRHWARAHHMCPHGECVGAVFATQVDLQVHLATVHNDRSARRLERHFLSGGGSTSASASGRRGGQSGGGHGPDHAPSSSSTPTAPPPRRAEGQDAFPTLGATVSSRSGTAAAARASAATAASLVSGGSRARLRNQAEFPTLGATADAADRVAPTASAPVAYAASRAAPAPASTGAAAASAGTGSDAPVFTLAGIPVKQGKQRRRKRRGGAPAPAPTSAAAAAEEGTAADAGSDAQAGTGDDDDGPSPPPGRWREWIVAFRTALAGDQGAGGDTPARARNARLLRALRAAEQAGSPGAAARFRELSRLLASGDLAPPSYAAEAISLLPANSSALVLGEAVALIPDEEQREGARRAVLEHVTATASVESEAGEEEEEEAGCSADAASGSASTPPPRHLAGPLSWLRFPSAAPARVWSLPQPEAPAPRVVPPPSSPCLARQTALLALARACAALLAVVDAALWEASPPHVSRRCDAPGASATPRAVAFTELAASLGVPGERLEAIAAVVPQLHDATLGTADWLTRVGATSAQGLAQISGALSQIAAVAAPGTASSAGPGERAAAESAAAQAGVGVFARALPASADRVLVRHWLALVAVRAARAFLGARTAARLARVPQHRVDLDRAARNEDAVFVPAQRRGTAVAEGVDGGSGDAEERPAEEPAERGGARPPPGFAPRARGGGSAAQRRAYGGLMPISQSGRRRGAEPAWGARPAGGSGRAPADAGEQGGQGRKEGKKKKKKTKVILASF